MSLILDGQKHNFRSVLKSGSIQEIEKQKLDLNLGLLFLANTYTGANFKNPPTKEQQATLLACSDFILEMFPMLSFKEIEHAFKMASAGKFEIDTATYYGKFSVQYLGKLLNSYLSYRRRILSVYSEHERKERKKIEEQKKVEKRNEETRKRIVQKYIDLKMKYKNGEFCKVDISGYFARYLTEQGFIKFSDEEKKEILEEAKVLVENDIKTELASPNKLNEFEKPSLINTLKQIRDGIYSDNFKAKVNRKYGELIIKKSLLK